MLLIGQYDSPFVRRVGIALQLYELPFEHRRWSVWRDADELARYNPLRRVPTLVLDDGTSLIESAAILDYLDDRVGSERALLPRTGPARHDGLRVCSFACGAGDKAVSLFYEPLLRDQPSTVWIDRCRAQVRDTFAQLEADFAARGTPYWLGERLGHPDIATACVIRFTDEAHPGLLEPARIPALSELAARCEELPVFRAIQQPFTVTVSKQS